MDSKTCECPQGPDSLSAIKLMESFRNYFGQLTLSPVFSPGLGIRVGRGLQVVCMWPACLESNAAVIWIIA